jgi:hypothetical protein
LLGEHFATARDFMHAEPLLLDAVAVVNKAVGPNNPRTLMNIRRLVALYTAWGKNAKAGEWQAKLPAAK